LSAQQDSPRIEPKNNDRVGSHIKTLAERLKEAYDIVRRENKIGREKQKLQYDRNTKLVTFSEGDYLYLKEMAVGAGKSKKFRSRWRGPYLIMKRFSDLNYQIQIKPGKHITVNVNRLKRCHGPPRETKPREEVLVDFENECSDEDWSDSDEEPLCLLGRPCQIPVLQNYEDAEIGEAAPADQTSQSRTVTPMALHRQLQVDEERQGEMLENPQDLGEVCPGATALDRTREATDDGNENVDPVGEEEQDTNQRQRYPYSLRPLPGRCNYESEKTNNK
jgi:hypothetical protein